MHMHKSNLCGLSMWEPSTGAYKFLAHVTLTPIFYQPNILDYIYILFCRKSEKVKVCDPPCLNNRIFFPSSTSIF